MITKTIMINLNSIVEKLHGLGYNVIPIHIRGKEKKPLVKEWKKWQNIRQSLEDVKNLDWGSANAVAVMTGGPEIKLFCIDVDHSKRGASAEVKELWIKGFVEIFGLKRQKTPHGWHFYGILDNEFRSMTIPGLLEVKAKNSLVVVRGPGYEDIDLTPESLPKISAEKLNKAIETLRRLWRLKLPLDLIRELRTEGERSEADMKLFHRLLREGWDDNDIYTAWTLLSDRFITEVKERKHSDPRNYFDLSFKKARECYTSDSWEASLLESRPLIQVIENAEPIRWRVDCLIPESGFGILAGRPGATKSINALLMAHALSSGHKLWNAFDVNEPCKVLIIDSENSESVFKDRVEMFKLNPLNNIEVSRPRNFRLDHEEHLKKFKEKIEKEGYGLVIIDPVGSFLGNADENDNAAMGRIGYELKRIADETNSFILGIHHSRKESPYISNPLDQVRGASALVASADIVMLLMNNGRSKYLRVVKNRLGPPKALEITFEEDGDGVKVTAKEIEIENVLTAAERCAEHILERVKAAGRMKRQDILAMTPFSRSMIDRVLKKLVEDGQLIKEGQGIYVYPSSTLDDEG